MPRKYKLKTIADFPHLVSQWHPSKNKKLQPSSVSSGSSKKIWWKCDKGPDHEWTAAAKDRTGIKPTGCPFCSNKKLSVTNSLAAKYPKIAKQWHPTKNDDLSPNKIVAGSTRVVWWKCETGPDHEWRAKVGIRWWGGGQGCPFCAGKRVSVTNSLSTKYPDVAEQWHPKKNGKLSPDKVLAASHKIVWWQCPRKRSHEFPAKILNRTLNKARCPYCTGQKVLEEDSLAKIRPDVAAFWHPSKNGKLKPNDVLPGSDRVIWWLCNQGPDHEWKAPVKSQTKKKSSICPYCMGRKFSVTNSLAALFPDIAKQWHPIKNGNLTPDSIIAGSHSKAWWKCDKGPDHEWRAQIRDRTKSGSTGCPCCAGQKVSITNSLKSLYPKIAKELHPTKNKGISADRIIARSGKLMWWQCLKNSEHIWQATPHNRTRGSSCPYCHIMPRSKEEILLAFELRDFIDFDIDDHKLQVDSTVLDIDIKIQDYKIAIEYDGSYWHQNKEKGDKEKAYIIEKAGWKVIRVREKPLKPITDQDICFPFSDLKEAANQLINKILCITEIQRKDFIKYKKRKTLKNKKLALEYINQLIDVQQNRT